VSTELLKEKYKGTEWEKLVEQLDSVKDLRKNYLEDYENLLPNRDVANSYVKRFRHYEDMIVKEVFPSVHTIEKPFEEEIKESEKVLEHHLTRNEIIEEFRNVQDPEYLSKVELEKEKQKNPKKTPLQMPQEERDKYLDKILTNTKESQIQEFVDNFSDYDPNEGDLPFMFRDLYYKNLQRLAYTFSSDPTYFTIDYFEENLNKEDYLRHAMNLVSKMKGTKTATEILFTILDIYEIQERAIHQYFQNKDLWHTYPEEKKKQIRYETIRRVIEKYKPILETKNIKTYEDVTKLYEKKKHQILDFLLKTTPEGYRLADAYFEKGRLHWEKYMKTQSSEELNKALSNWKTSLSYSTSGKGDFLNKETLEQILPYIKTSQVAEANKNAIQMYVLGRLNKHLEAKRLREEKLLWKK
ncbi:MAG: hypothetical protein N3A69_03360, partial [Leptospiraceae bacterium]|nr:hypothetical protein [Leptospiraceae bacterium]